MTQLLESRKSKAAQVASVTAKLTMSIGERVDALHDLRERKRELEAQVKELEGEYQGIEKELLEELERQEINATRGKKASCSISEQTVANIVDFDAVCKHVKKKGWFHLFERRISSASYREILERGETVPGLQPFTRKRLNLRSL